MALLFVFPWCYLWLASNLDALQDGLLDFNYLPNRASTLQRPRKFPKIRACGAV